MSQPHSFGGGLVRPVPVPTKRRVFFSFHYQQDVNRVNIVRNSWVTRVGEENQAFGFYDASLWENSQRRGDDSIKELIRGGIENSSVTCILTGTWTYSRRWVRYEIARSVARENGLLCVRIHGLTCIKTKGTCSAGPNPLIHMGVAWKPDGKAYLCERRGAEWAWYEDYTSAVPWPRYLQNASVNTVQQLSTGTLEYDYVAQKGYSNFSVWVALAARHAGR